MFQLHNLVFLYLTVSLHVCVCIVYVLYLRPMEAERRCQIPGTRVTDVCE